MHASIHYKINDKDKNWHKLDEYIIRSTDKDKDDNNQHISVNLNIKQSKIKAINACSDEPPPIITFDRNQMSVIFNSTNNQPFI
ncbi:hypothetical protein A9G41_07170 [Gilliamella sp. Nev5-1]|uniref:hypothetical protein n=1 Tax=unclassified Gilliamella TaxID=2685620 RepID=UPI00080ED672|nr:hypothetical protein [Gilliamella apicola]OCG59981.1 hypothetical protein A9G40_05460 [Gilliamella apicola]OCG69074.1 hypothetical protein A9G41_07170 [Gilliamella apicola]